jgi:hypothetical protein
VDVVDVVVVMEGEDEVVEDLHLGQEDEDEAVVHLPSDPCILLN